MTTATLSRRAASHPVLTLAAASALWLSAYRLLVPVSERLVALLPVDRSSHLGAALQFFLYDTPKVLLLLTGVVFVMGIVNSWFTPERTRALLARHGGATAYVLAAGLGVVTPFCSCSAVPLFIGFVQAGVPLGATLTFLVAAPMVNEIALTLLFGLFGWRVAALYLALGLVVAVAAGLVIGQLRMERYLQDWVRDLERVEADAGSNHMSVAARLEAGATAVHDVVRRVWPYIVGGIAVGAAIHGYVPDDLMARVMGRGAWWSVPLAVVIGVPMYSNAAGILPVVEALLAKGAALGTVLAFMMSVIGLSLPEVIILKNVLKVPLIATFVGVVACGILVVGYVFNAVL